MRCTRDLYTYYIFLVLKQYKAMDPSFILASFWLANINGVTV